MKQNILFSMLSFLFLFNGYSYSVLLVNDSPFELFAVVLAADGSTLGQQSLQPGEQNTWNSGLTHTELQATDSPSVSLTPFTVIWRCSYKGMYSMCSNVAPGSTVAANTCAGDHYCEPKPQKQDSQESP